MNRFKLIVVLALGVIVSGCDVDSVKDNATADNAGLKADKQIVEALAGLSAEDRRLAGAQRFCPVHVYHRLGSRGTPVKVETTGKPIFVCTQECVEDVKQGGAAIKRIASGLRKSTARLAELPAEERAIAEAQKYCPVMSSRLLGTMGAPIKLVLAGKPIYICCPDCVEDAEADPAEILARAEKLKSREVGRQEVHGDHQHEHHMHDDKKDHRHEHDDHEHHNNEHDGHGDQPARE